MHQNATFEEQKLKNFLWRKVQLLFRCVGRGHPPHATPWWPPWPPVEIFLGLCAL